MIHKIKLTVIFIALFSLNSCKKEEKEVLVNDAIDTKKTVYLSSGNFVKLQHNLSGTSSIIIDSTGNKMLRFENFNVEPGPDVNIYLSTTKDFKDVIDLGNIKGTKGNINYDFDDKIDTDTYKFAIVWCVEFSANFGYAEMKKPN